MSEKFVYARRIELRFAEDGDFVATTGPITSTEALSEMFSRLLRRCVKEACCSLFLDEAGHPLGYSLTEGGLDYVAVDIRQILREAILVRATKIALGHNHPVRGLSRPSDADRLFAIQLNELAAVVGIEVFDFQVIGLDGEVYSFRREKDPALQVIDRFRGGNVILRLRG